MKLNDTVEMMNSEDYKERFKAEYFQLTIRCEGLSNMLDRYSKGTLNFKPNCSYSLLERQLIHMECYQKALEDRAKIEGIDLSEEDK